MPDWNARRILKELLDAERRRQVLADFWRLADTGTRAAALATLARAFNFREVRLRAMPPERKADLLAARASLPECEHYLETALLVHHTHHANALMAAFLDRWGVPHANGEIGSDEVTPPTETSVRDAVAALADAFPRADVRLYLAAAGLLMGPDWSAATWPVVDELA